VTDFGTVLDPYNQEDPFGIVGSGYADAFASNLSSFDAYDGATDWEPDVADQWVSRIASGNYLVIDTSMPCDYADPHTYLELERSTMSGRDYTTCGGRMPNEDALDVTLNFLIRGPGASALDDGAIHDGVDAPTQLAGDEFPYLAEMN
jgi:hypothetical protein